MCATDCVELTGKGNQGKTTRQFKVTIVVNIKVMLLRIVTPSSLVQVTKMNGVIFSHHLQDSLEEGGSVFPLTPPTCLSHSQCQYSSHQPAHNQQNISLLFNSVCRSKLLHGQSLHATEFFVFIIFIQLCFLSIYRPIEKHHQYIISWDWAGKQSFA
jgi:hypothetical protein